MASGGGSGFDLNVGISLDGVIIYAVDDVASVVEDGKLPRQPMALTGRITDARGGGGTKSKEMVILGLEPRTTALLALRSTD